MENISSSATVRADRAEKVYITSIIYKAIILFLITFILVCFLFVLGVFKNLSYIPEDVRVLILETVVCDNCKDFFEEETSPITVSIKNKGWTLYQYPQYGFNIEIPTDTYPIPDNDKTIANMNIWSIKSFDLSNKDDFTGLFNYYSKSIHLSLEPQVIQSDNVCDFLCSGEVHISIDFYENKDLKVLGEVEKILIGKIGDLSNYKIENVYLFEEDVLKYEDLSNKSVISKGYVFLNGNYIVFIKEESNVDEEIYKVVERILNSIKFE